MEFEKIYTTYFRDVFLYIRRLSNDEHIAEEITSETFFKAMNSIDSFRGDCDIRVWLCQIAKNCYYSFLKNTGRTENIDTPELLQIADSEMSVDERLARKETVKALQGLLHRLPEPYKEVFSLRVFGQLSFEKIGLIFGRTANWACVTYHRARQKIQKEMEEGT